MAKDGLRLCYGWLKAWTEIADEANANCQQDLAACALTLKLHTGTEPLFKLTFLLAC